MAYDSTAYLMKEAILKENHLGRKIIDKTFVMYKDKSKGKYQ